MRAALLFTVALCAFLALTLAAQPTCNNPIFEQINQQAWHFLYLNNPKLYNAASAICPNISHEASCCDQAIFDKMLLRWKIAFAKAEAVSQDITELDKVVQFVATEITNLQNSISKSAKLTSAEKQTINTFLSTWQQALQNLIPGLQQNFDACFSSVLRFWAGLVCKGCEVLWNDWVSVIESDNAKQIVLNFANKTCQTLIGDCLPFFQPFVTYINSFNSASATMLSQLSGSVKAEIIADLAAITPYEPPCLNNHDCGTFLCYEWLHGFDRDDSSWRNSFKESSTTRFARMPTLFSSSLALSTVAIHEKMARIVEEHEERTKSDVVVNQVYTGTYDPYDTPTTLSTNTSGASSLSAFWMAWF